VAPVFACAFVGNRVLQAVGAPFVWTGGYIDSERSAGRTPVYDTIGAHPSRLVVPTTGTYWVHAHSRIEPTVSGPVELVVRQNGSVDWVRAIVPGVATVSRDVSLGALLYLSAGDYLELIVFAQPGATYWGSNADRCDMTELSLMRVG